MITATEIPQRWRTMVFDCDGVILNSNKIKSAAFYQAALKYGEEKANRLRQYHIDNGGVSRYIKFRYFLSDIVGKRDGFEAELQNLLNHYARIVQSELMQCQIAEKLKELKGATEGITWLVVSGSDQDELRNIFEKRNISNLFEGGIFGSPDTKETILSREIMKENIVKPAVFFGDTNYDHKAAVESGLDFVFVRDWSESKASINSFQNDIPKLSALL